MPYTVSAIQTITTLLGKRDIVQSMVCGVESHKDADMLALDISRTVLGCRGVVTWEARAPRLEVVRTVVRTVVRA